MTKQDEAIKLIKKGNYLDAAELLSCIKAESVTNPKKLRDYFIKWMYKKVEYFLVCTLNDESKIINIYEITKGTVNTVSIHPRDVFRPAILDNATGVIIAHNHPSGSLIFSKHDKRTTANLIKAGKILNIPIVDSIVIGHGEIASALEKGVIKQEIN
jgi:DNA repair protein RadC